MYLPLLEEQPSRLFFIRPHRFGKSIFLSMMRAYYDIRQKDKFQEFFGLSVRSVIRVMPQLTYQEMLMRRLPKEKQPAHYLGST